MSSSEKSCVGPHFDTDAMYRKRLAEEAKAFCSNEEIAGLFRDGWDGTLEQLEDELKRHPDAQSRLAYLTQYTTSKWLLERELIARGALRDGQDAYEAARNADAVGVCLSGGGIRSATFNLGVLQGLASLNRLRGIDYLSTVSGGGFIHEFLASWIHQAKKLETVQEQLKPIPATAAKADGTARIVAPEPIRWLRQYSNYLSPSVKLFGADVWTIAAVWARNTLLNMTVLIAVLMSALMVPYFGLTHLLRTCLDYVPASPGMRLLIAAFFFLCCVVAAFWLYVSFPQFCVAPPEGRSAKQEDMCKRNSTKKRDPYIIVGLWLVVVLAVAPGVYRLSIPFGSEASGAPRQDDAGSGGKAHGGTGRANGGAEPEDAYPLKASSHGWRYPRGSFDAYRHEVPEAVAGKMRIVTDKDGALAEWATCGQAGSHCPKTPSRLERSWSEYKPRCIVLSWVKTLAPSCDTYREAYQTHRLMPLSDKNDGKPMESPLAWVFEFFPVMCGVFCCGILRRRKEDLKWWEQALGWLCPFGAALFALLAVEGIRRVFFAATFTVDQNLIASLGIVLLPSLLLAVPFMSLECCTGLLNDQLGSAQREWVARLRAVSFQIGVVWLVFSGVALIGPFVYERIAAVVAVKYTVWLTWAGSTLAGVLLGKSKSTNGNGKGADDPDKPGGWSVAEIVIKVAPPVFIAGLFLLLSKWAEVMLIRDATIASRWVPLLHWVVAFAVTAAIALLFGWRIDINEFSMNSFYRDRLARCYVGASNPRRDPNLFTGFDVDDGGLRLAQLLPASWTGLDEKKGEYDGPFPIFCTALNLTTGRELAYQERKAASFAFTPLYSGYSTGWTEGTDSRLQYNGFVPTKCHIKAGKGITMASVVAISGAAASPNMGYHSNTAMAFLMTIFNVRLGWWIRNPRRAGADYPAVGMFRLLKELSASTDDTSKFVYLSDGGHFDNMGLYELLRRRCRRIVVCDAEEDAALRFEGIGMAIRKARVDFGVEVTFTRSVDRPEHMPNDAERIANLLSVAVNAQGGAEAAPEPPNKKAPIGAEGVLDFKHFPGNLVHALEGAIQYPEDGGVPSGTILYLKSTLTEDEPADVLNYHRAHASFPFDSTLNQFFTESQFESYRKLGEHIALNAQIAERIQSLIPDRKSDAGRIP